MAAGQQDHAVQMAGTSGTRIKENRWKAETVQVTASDSWPQKVMTKQPDAEGMNSSYMRLRSSTRVNQSQTRGLALMRNPREEQSCAKC
ncbi:hypothetical protein NPIL_139461 [Nephila pilipes]|uniref:Uncharacterized protein n=1 Tax=Nephila pilipes TaxID=299642 RepID=A0A8X6PFX9_NEPPI|nr:hypothetical protein NPIL_139461 [Nephila pilipes]